MSMKIERPITLQINGWSSDRSNTGELPDRTPWAGCQFGRPNLQALTWAPKADPRDWQHPDVGWGLVLPEPADDAMPAADRATAADAPEAIQRLVRSRPGSPVLRWSAKLGDGYLRRYEATGAKEDLSIQALRAGVREGHIPRYLLIYASPKQIPWTVQYALNMSAFVGRLDLEGEALNTYADALIADWPERSCVPAKPLLWSPDHGSGDITWLMARTIAGPLSRQFADNSDMTAYWLKNEAATADNLITALAERRPGLIVTTSHGVTGPFSVPGWTARLGLPVGVDHVPLAPEQLAAWKPSGAIWYSHACCAAGADAPSRYDGLLPASNPIAQTISGVAAEAGPMVSPLPRALLGCAQPLRAFVGHVEPTFDWTLRDPLTQEPLAHVIEEALSQTLFQQDRRVPIGFALARLFDEAGHFFATWKVALDGINSRVEGARDRALYNNLVALDRQTTVIIGDPTVSLPLFR